MASQESFRPKTSPELIKQIENVSQAIGTPIIPQSDYESVITTPLEDLKRTYPRRYEVYANTLKHLRGGEVVWEATDDLRIRTLNALDNYIRTHFTHEEGRTLRGYQIGVFENLRGFLEQGGEEGYIKLPSGSGKTVLFTEFVEATNLRTLVVVPTTLLVDQTAERFRQFARGIETGKLYGDQKEYDKQVTITTYASFIKNIREENLNPDDYDLLILDEAHKALGSRRAPLVGTFEKAIKLGFTATPKYSEDRQLKSLLPAEIHNMSIREAVELGVISPLSVYIVRTDVDLSEVKVHALGDYETGDLERKINIVRRNLGAVEIYQKMFNGKPAIAYCVGIKHAKDLAYTFQKQGIVADFISGDDSRQEQQAKIARFRSREIKVMCNADILIEGFDEPSAVICLNLRPTLSPVIAEQRAGRVLRPNPYDPDKMAYIVDFIDGDIKGRQIAVSFAQIVEAAQVFRKTFTVGSNNKQEQGTSRYPEIEIEGMKVITDAEEVLRLARKMEGKSEKGWSSFTALSRRYRLSESVINGVVNYLQEQYKDRDIFLIDKETKESYLSPEFSERLGEIIINFKRPEDWFTATTISHELNRARATIITEVNKYRQEHQEWFRKFIGDPGEFTEHYSSELVIILRKRLGVRQPAAEGWVTRPNLVKEINKSAKYVKKIEKEYQLKHPEWFKKYEATKGGFCVHLSPELVAVIKERASYERPEGWFSSADLQAIFHCKVELINEYATELSDGHPEWVRVKKIPNAERRWYAPELAERMKQAIGIYQERPEGWLSLTEAAETFGKERKYNSYFLIRAKKYRELHPEWFINIYNVERRRGRWYAPELIGAIKQDLAGEQKPPDGWIRVYSLSKLVGSSQRTVKKILTEYRDENPEWFGQYLYRIGAFTEFCSPELVSEIKRRWYRGNKIE